MSSGAPLTIPRSRVKHRLAAMFTWLLLATYAASWGHQLLVVHATCAEHGEQVHAVENAPSPVGAFAKTQRAAPDEDSVRGRVQLAEAHGHEHCIGVLQHRESLAPRALTAAVGLKSLPGPVRQCNASPIRTHSHPLLLLAPKSSPPVRA